MYQERFYRAAVLSLNKLEVSYKESDLFISSDNPIDKSFAQSVLEKYYCQIEEYVKAYPEFASSLSSLAMDDSAPEIVKDMLASSPKRPVCLPSPHVDASCHEFFSDSFGYDSFTRAGKADEFDNHRLPHIPARASLTTVPSGSVASILRTLSASRCNNPDSLSSLEPTVSSL